MKITYYGHACVGIKTGDFSILVDPFITGNPLASHINVDEIPADFILLTHAHNDHVLDVERIAERTHATIISTYEVAVYFEQKGFKIHPMNHGGSWHFDFGKIKVVNAIHSSSFPNGNYGGNPAGFVIEADKNIYISGDTALTLDMKLIPMRTKLDLAILCMGSNFTMDVDDAVIASDFVECNQVMGYHYDTFGYIKINHEEATEKFANVGKTLHLLEIGAEIFIE